MRDVVDSHGRPGGRARPSANAAPAPNLRFDDQRVDANIRIREDEWASDRSRSPARAVSSLDAFAEVAIVQLVPAETPVAVLLQRLDVAPVPIRLLQPRETAASGLVESISWNRWSAIRESSRMLRFLQEPLVQLPAILALNIVALYAGILPVQSLKQLAAVTRLSERHVRRLLTTSGIRSAHLMFSASRVLRAQGEVAAKVRPLGGLACEYGFGTSRTLRSQWTQVFGRSLQRMVVGPVTETELQRVAALICGHTSWVHAMTRQCRSACHDAAVSQLDETTNSMIDDRR